MFRNMSPILQLLYVPKFCKCNRHLLCWSWGQVYWLFFFVGSAVGGSEAGLIIK